MRLNQTWRPPSYSEWPQRCCNCRFYRLGEDPPPYCTVKGLEHRYFAVDPMGHCKLFRFPVKPPKQRI